ncbi:succinate--CoA ligase subunit alpha [Limibacillus halophilus]|uniref:Succinyl-CoA synthetase alpha subunit n=1 Tax=Limibacillus halophilus TaxID=1579333 RepID=A0A839SPF4_9PROT|nr:succinate--CoA ligase subunit alpha [Limibacillus halophilus]MBB3063744.1 succinyl-CoA synthetase alpha subunit [Limibacillus halophilus]
MAILVNGDSRIVIQGITGHTGRNLADKLLSEGTPLVGGVSPKRGGETVSGLPVFSSCHEAVAIARANCAFLSVPAGQACAAAFEAIDAGIKTMVVYAEGVPVQDAARIAAYAAYRGVNLIGPNAAGCISPGLANLSDLNGKLLRRGPIGIVSKSGTLTYEVIDSLNAKGLGQSSVVCLGGDPIIGMSHADALHLFDADPDTTAVVLIGEIGGRSELQAAEVARHMKKPVVAYIAGLHAPAGKTMGHAGAILGSPEENVPGKRAALERAGAIVVNDVIGVGAALARLKAPAEVD